MQSSSKYKNSIEIPTTISVFTSINQQLGATKNLRQSINQPWSDRVSLVKNTDINTNQVNIVCLLFTDNLTAEQVTEYKQIIISKLPT